MTMDSKTDEITEPVQLELPLEFPTPQTVLPPDAALTLVTANKYMDVVVLFPSRFGVDEYETALQWQTLTKSEREIILANARGIANV